MKRDTRLVMLLLLVIGCSLTSLTIWKVLSSRDRALAEVDVHGLNLTQALNTYTEGIVRQSSLLLLGLVERLETEGSGPVQIQRISTLINLQQPLMPQLSGITAQHMPLVMAWISWKVESLSSTASGARPRLRKLRSSDWR